MTPSVPQSIHTVSTPPPVVADTVDSDSGANYEQKASRKKGLLSTILSKQNQHTATTGGNTTLG